MQGRQTSMNLSRSLARFLSSSSSSRTSTHKCLVLQSSAYATSSAKNNRKPKPSPPTPKPDEQTPHVGLRETPQIPPKELTSWPRPIEIPYQTKVANSVHLIGSLRNPVQFDVSSDGKYWAQSVLMQEQSEEFPQLWIPIVFEGDLAQIAACHLKLNDLVYVTGQLSGMPPPFTLEQGKTSVQVVVNSISFVQKTSPKDKLQVPSESKKVLETPVKAADSTDRFWRDLVVNSKQWSDCRLDKLNGLKSQKHPDFKHKETKQSLWLDSAPQWVHVELKGVEFEVQTHNDQVSAPKKTAVEELWKDLVENPDKWWDNRLDKESGTVNPKFPDFKNKETGEALWIDARSTPAWLLPRLPLVKSKQEMAVRRKHDIPEMPIF